MMMRILCVKMSLKVRLPPVHPMSVPPHMNRLTGEAPSEEHVEYLLGRHVRLEAVSRVVLVEASTMSGVGVTRGAVGGRLRAVQVVLTSFFVV